MAQPIAPTITGSAPQQDTYLRVRADQITQLLDMVGELGLLTAEVTTHPDLAGLELESFAEAAYRLKTLVRELQDLASELRLVPVGVIFKRMQRLVRDLAQETGKAVELLTQGEETQIDKAVVDQLNDPLVHLIRNAIDHGLEPAAERQAAGKPATGKITLAARQQGREIVISVADDGRGLNREAILSRARELGLVPPGAEPDDQTVWNLIFKPGFSTAPQISSLSGRGVGMDVVQTTVQSLRGRIAIDSRPGQGATTTLFLPLTLAFLDSLVVKAQNRLYAIPVDMVTEVLRPEPTQIARIVDGQTEVIRVREKLTPVCHLSLFYRKDHPLPPLTDQIVLVVQTTGGQLALPVDEIIGQQQVTMKPLQGQLAGIRGGIGCALLSSGEVAIALDCDSISREMMQAG